MYPYNSQSSVELEKSKIRYMIPEAVYLLKKQVHNSSANSKTSSEKQILTDNNRPADPTW